MPFNDILIILNKQGVTKTSLTFIIEDFVTQKSLTEILLEIDNNTFEKVLLSNFPTEPPSKTFEWRKVFFKVCNLLSKRTGFTFF